MRYLLHREIYNTELSRVSLPTMTVTFSDARILEQVMDVSLNLDQNKANWTVKVLTRKLVGELNFPKLEENTIMHLNQTNK